MEIDKKKSIVISVDDFGVAENDKEHFHAFRCTRLCENNKSNIKPIKSVLKYSITRHRTNMHLKQRVGVEVEGRDKEGDTQRMQIN